MINRVCMQCNRMITDARDFVLFDHIGASEWAFHRQKCWAKVRFMMEKRWDTPVAIFDNISLMGRSRHR